MKFIYKALYVLITYNIIMQEEHISRIVGAIFNGRNVLINGAGGCGKSYSLRYVIQILRAKGYRVYATATTGVAALNLSDRSKLIYTRTLHSWAGIEMGQGTAEQLLQLVKSKSRPTKNWLNTEVLV